ncbi:MAG: hypothetical protein EPN36_02545 [Rhodanobacteraceae bacterium]|nr:MAG: hypothetical protein EPN36_02545 [Rhodanobacteraceae bacterium]
MDYKVHPWTLPQGPAFGRSNSFQTNLSGFRRNDVKTDIDAESLTRTKRFKVQDASPLLAPLSQGGGSKRSFDQGLWGYDRFHGASKFGLFHTGMLQ